MRTFLDPTGELEPIARMPLEKLNSLEGKTLGLLDISKAKGDVFLDRLEQIFSDTGVKVQRFKKPTFARPAPVGLIRDMSESIDVVIEGLAD